MSATLWEGSKNIFFALFDYKKHVLKKYTKETTLSGGSARCGQRPQKTFVLDHSLKRTIAKKLTQ